MAQFRKHARAVRTVSGPTDRVVVVGAGLGGLACALRLVGAGRHVTVIERAPAPGGRAGQLCSGGYRFDTGPTVLTMPHLIDEALAAVGEQLKDRVELIRLDPVYRAHFADGSQLDVRADTAATAAGIAELCGAREADGYLRFVEYARLLYQLEWSRFIDRNIDSPLDLFSGDLARLVAAGGFRSLSGKVGQYLADPRTRRLFTFQALYAGLAPDRARALYAVIAYMDTVAGVYFPRGGMHAVPRAMADAAADHGVEFHYSCEATSVEVSGGRARAVHTADGRRIPADVVVLNPDLPIASRDLLGREPRRRMEYSPSCVVLHLGVPAGLAGSAHHNIHFGGAWQNTFDELTRRGTVMSDPSLFVGIPTRTDPELAPPDRDALYVLAPAPNLDASIDWDRTGERYADELIATLEQRGYAGLGSAVTERHVVTPSDWGRAGMAAGTPFAAAHTVRQSGPWRPGNLASGLENVVFVGSGTQPGVGVPMVVVSGRLAAERVLGPAAQSS